MKTTDHEHSEAIDLAVSWYIQHIRNCSSGADLMLQQNLGLTQSEFIEARSEIRRLLEVNHD